MIPLPAPPKAPSPPALTFALLGRIGSAIAPVAKLEAGAELGLTYFEPLEFYVGGAYGPAQSDSRLRISDWVAWAGLGYEVIQLEPISVAVRAAFEDGQVESTGLGVTPELTLQRRWLAVNVGAAGRLTIAGPLFFQAFVGTRATIEPQRYVVTEDKAPAPVYLQHRFGVLASFSVGMHFL